MKQYQRFVFETYSFDPESRTIELVYSLDEELIFREYITLPKGGELQNLDSTDLDQALFSLHLIGGVSYYKTCLPPSIEIKSGHLSKEQAEFWNSVYENGLGEFFYQNQIDFRGLITFPYSEGVAGAKLEENPRKALDEMRFLLPFGGGKDSVVSLELLKKVSAQIALFRLGDHPLIQELAQTAQLPLLLLGRQLDPQLFNLNKEGVLNGHVPITGYISALTVVVSLLFGFDAVMMSNERSATEGNVEYLGKEINHQWSKGAEFEKMFQNYLADFVTTKVQYLNILRPLSELHIAQIFSRYPQYFYQATSCNRNWHILEERKTDQRWCGTCPKCAFAYLLFSAYLPQEQVQDIFAKNLFEDSSLAPLYREIVGVEGFKPFECVGTAAESKAAFYLAFQQAGAKETAIGQMIQKEVPIVNPEGLLMEALTPQAAQNIPQLSQEILSQIGIIS